MPKAWGWAVKMRQQGWITLLLLLLISMPPAIATMKIGLIIAPPFVSSGKAAGILDDELDIMFIHSPKPEIHRFVSADESLKALEQGLIDIVIASQAPAPSLQASAPLISFSMAALRLENGSSGTLCFPDLPGNLTSSCSLSAKTASTEESIRQLIRGDASRFIAPEFILRRWRVHTPATTFSLNAEDALPPLNFYGWALSNRTDALKEINAHIRAIDPEDARWLEEKWFLPDDTVFSTRNLLTSEKTSRLTLQVLLPVASAPFVQMMADGHIHGVWYSLVSKLFPAHHFSLTFGMNLPSISLPAQPGQVRLKIVASQSPPAPGAIEFDALTWGLVSPKEKALPGLFPALTHRRIAVIQDSPLLSLLRQKLPQQNLVMVKDPEQGFELIRAGGANGLAGEAYTLNYALRQREDTALQLTPLDLPGTPLWFVVEGSDAASMQRVTEILTSLTRAEIFRERAKPLAALNDNHPAVNREVWIGLLAIVLFCMALLVLVIWKTAQRRSRQRARDTSALHNALSLWQTLMNNAPVPLFVCDPSGRLTRYNDAFVRSPLLADTPEEGSLFINLPLGELAKQFALPHRLTLLNSPTPLTGETCVIPSRRTLYWWLCSYTDNVGQPQGIVGGWVDISEKAELTAALNLALKQAERASQEKSNFLARMSHDIRTPLNALLGLLELEKDRSNSLMVAWQSAGSLRDLIGDILDLSRIEAGELRLELAQHSLWQILHTSEEIFGHSATAKMLQWEAVLDIPRHTLFYLDKPRIEQVVANLLSNAIKYTPEGKVTFSARLKGDSLELRVTDTGIGITPDAMPLIGQPWFQNDPSTPQSSGLGLAICHQLVDLMGGKITFTSVPDQGTEVTVLLPLQPAAEQARDIAEPVSLPLPRRRVMIVDDFPANLTVLRLQLEKLGQEVIACGNASEALARLATDPADILITDCQMPHTDGYQLSMLLLIREVAGTAPAPAIILGCTANALLEENDRAQHAGMDALLRKPLTLEELQRALTQHPAPVADACDLTELYQLADGRHDVITLMRDQMQEALQQDLLQLSSSPHSAEALAKLAHRLKASWSLLSMREATRQCQAMEALPDLIQAGLVDEAQIPTLTERFALLMQESVIRLEHAQAELSDKY